MKKLLLLLIAVVIVVGLETLRSTQDVENLTEQGMGMDVAMEEQDDADTVKSEFVQEYGGQCNEISGALVGSGGGTRF